MAAYLLLERKGPRAEWAERDLDYLRTHIETHWPETVRVVTIDENGLADVLKRTRAGGLYVQQVAERLGELFTLPIE